MIIPFTQSFGEAIVKNHSGPKNNPPISVYVKHFHRNGCYSEYRIVCNKIIKTYQNKTLNQISGILKKLGY